MTIFRFSMLALATSLILPTPSSAFFDESVSFMLSAKVLKQACRESRASPDYENQNRVCSGYISGFLDGAKSIEVMEEAKNWWCIPSNQTGQQTIDQIKKAIINGSEKSYEHAATVVFAAALVAFPCETKK